MFKVQELYNGLYKYSETDLDRDPPISVDAHFFDTLKRIHFYN